MLRRLFLDFKKPSVQLVYRFWHNLEKRAAENKICDKIQNWHGALSFQPALRSKGWVLRLRGEAVGSRRWSCTCYTNCTNTLNGSPSLEKSKEGGQSCRELFQDVTFSLPSKISSEPWTTSPLPDYPVRDISAAHNFQMDRVRQNVISGKLNH